MEEGSLEPFKVPFQTLKSQVIYKICFISFVIVKKDESTQKHHPSPLDALLWTTGFLVSNLKYLFWLGGFWLL